MALWDRLFSKKKEGKDPEPSEDAIKEALATLTAGDKVAFNRAKNLIEAGKIPSSEDQAVYDTVMADAEAAGGEPAGESEGEPEEEAPRRGLTVSIILGVLAIIAVIVGFIVLTDPGGIVPADVYNAFGFTKQDLPKAKQPPQATSAGKFSVVIGQVTVDAPFYGADRQTIQGTLKTGDQYAMITQDPNGRLPGGWVVLLPRDGGAVLAKGDKIGLANSTPHSIDAPAADALLSAVSPVADNTGKTTDSKLSQGSGEGSALLWLVIVIAGLASIMSAYGRNGGIDDLIVVVLILLVSIAAGILLRQTAEITVVGAKLPVEGSAQWINLIAQHTASWLCLFALVFLVILCLNPILHNEVDEQEEVFAGETRKKLVRETFWFKSVSFQPLGDALLWYAILAVKGVPTIVSVAVGTLNQSSLGLWLAAVAAVVYMLEDIRAHAVRPALMASLAVILYPFVRNYLPVDVAVLATLLAMVLLGVVGTRRYVPGEGYWGFGSWVKVMLMPMALGVALLTLV